MAEIVPNRVPCGKKPTPTPPQPEPIPVTLCDLTGIKYFKLQSEIPGDYTKNCGLLGNEIDENFYFLRSMDIKTAYTIDENGRKILVLERVNCGREIKVDITDDDAYQFRLEDGYIIITYPDGHEEKIGKFLVEGDNVHIVTDASIQGDGSYGNPIGVDLAYRTGTYAPADFYADLTCTGATLDSISGIVYGHAVVTKENVSRFGALYTWDQAHKLDEALAKEGRGWRLPSKEDWAALLNWAEPLEEAKNHDTNKSGNFGCVAGNRLKAKDFWMVEKPATAPVDDFGMAIYPVGVCPENYNTKEPQKFGFTGLYKTTSFWTSSEADTGEHYVRSFSYGHDDVAQFTESRKKRLSIRLVRDVETDFDIDGFADILGNFVPVTLTTDGKQLWTTVNVSILNYDGFNQNEVTVPDEWEDIITTATVRTYYELRDCEYVEVEEYELRSDAEPVFVEEVPTEVYTDSDPYIYTESILHFDMLTEAKFYYNAWDGNRWHKKLMREGESVVLLYEDFETGCDTAATPYVTSANTNHEWRVFVNPQTGLDELIDTVEAIKREMDKEFKEIHELISGLTENVNNLSGFVGDMYDEMQSGFSSAFTAISDLQDELDVVEASVGLSGDGSFVVIRESGITSGATTIAEAIGILDDVILEDEEIVAASLNDLNRRMINLSGVVEEMKDQQDQTQEEIDNIENGVGLDEDGNHIPNDCNYTSSAETVEEEISALDDALKEVSDEVEELKKKTIEPLDASIVVEVSGYTTYVGVQLDPEDEHIKLGDNGLWFDGDFGEATPDEYMPEGN